MPKVIEAVYEKGVIKPLEKVEMKRKGKVIVLLMERKEKKYLRRTKFLSKLKPIDTRRKITLEEIEKLRVERYEGLS